MSERSEADTQSPETKDKSSVLSTIDFNDALDQNSARTTSISIKDGEESNDNNNNNNESESHTSGVVTDDTDKKESPVKEAERLKKEEEEKLAAEEAERLKKEEEEKLAAEEAERLKKEEEEKLAAEEAERLKKEEEEKLAAEEAERLKKEEEEKLAAEEAKRLKKEEEEKLAAEEAERLKKEEEEKLAAEEAERLKKEEEEKLAAEEAERLKKEEEEKLAAEEAERLKKEEEEKLAAEEAERLKKEEEEKLAAEEAERLKNEEEEKLKNMPVAIASTGTNRAVTISDSGKPRPVVICGPSGAGKGTLIESLMKKFPDDQFGFSVSHTTRKPRDGEVNGLHYNFTDIDTIKSDIESGKFIEYAEVHGNYYGTSVDAVRSVQQKGQICILDIDVQGVRKVKETSLNPYYVFIAPPSMEDLEVRLRGRGTEKEEDIQKRLKNAAGEMEYGRQTGNFDKYLINGDLSKASAELSATMKTWYPHLSEAITEGGNAFVRQCASVVGHCVIS